MDITYSKRVPPLVRCLVALLAGCGGGAQDIGALALAQTAAVAPTASKAQTLSSSGPGFASPDKAIAAHWRRLGEIRGLCCNYTPLVIKDGRPHFFSNVLNRRVDGQLVRYEGSWTRVGTGQVVLAASAITDVGPSAYKVRTAGIRHDPAVGWVAILHVGQGYPTSDGYVPALATSADGVQWTYRGKLQIEGRVWPAFSDAANLILQMNKPGVLNAQQPFENRYVILENNFNVDGRARKLVAIYSADGSDWRFYRDGSGHIVDLWPADPALAADQPVWPTADSVQGDIHLIVGASWNESTGVRAHRHLCAPRGSNSFKYLGDAATWREGSKAPNVGYDASTDILYAVDSAAGYALHNASTACR